jgi:hypothetical protein
MSNAHMLKQSKKIIEKFNEDKELVWRIDKDRKIYEYHVKPGSAQYDIFRKILFKGFEKTPQGVYRNGYGIQRNGSYLVNEIKKRLGNNIALTIQVKGRSELRKVKRKYQLIFNYNDFQGLLQEHARLNNLKNQDYRNYLLNQLYGLFPNSKFVRKKELIPQGSYKADSLHDLINSSSFSITRLSANDLKALANILPKFVDRHGATLLGPNDAKKVLALRNKSQRVYLDRIIADFESRLKRKHHNENEWQKFLRNYILFANSNYTDVVEKASITLQGKYPDFMLIDSYDCARQQFMIPKLEKIG